MRRAALAALVGLALLVGCDRGERERTPPAPSTYRLVETARPGQTDRIAEVFTLDALSAVDHPELGAVQIRHETEFAKEIELEIVQVDLDGRPNRYRKRFASVRSRATTTIGTDPPVVEASIHPIEGHTVEYVFRDENGWTSRPIEPGVAPDAVPAPRDQRGHPWLPVDEVSVGDRWSATSLPFSLPDASLEAAVTIELSGVDPARDPPLATLALTGTLTDPAGGARGEFAGRLRFALAEEGGRIVETQVEGTLVDESETTAKITTTFTVYRARGSEP